MTILGPRHKSGGYLFGRVVAGWWIRQATRRHARKVFDVIIWTLLVFLAVAAVWLWMSVPDQGLLIR